ncbi:MAG: YggS family pyridoxal phosphate-dependent enzyme [Bacteroidota bacterium]
MSISANLTHIQTAIAEAAQTHDRSPASVKLVAVSKTKPIELIQEAFQSGQRIFGENRVQELREKHPLLPEAEWHMIGSLQRNKVKYIAPFISLIHSVDSERLLAEVSKQGAKHERIIPCLIQMNISEEDAKSGLDEAGVRGLLERLDEFPHVEIKGLMGMAAFIADEAEISRQFGRLRKALESCQDIEHDRLDLRELSMGMSGDFPLAIAQGATLVRIGSAVFGSR